MKSGCYGFGYYGDYALKVNMIYLKMNKIKFLLWLRMVNMDLSKEELQLIYLGLHTISTSYVIKGDLESVFLNLLDKVSIEIDK